MLFRRKPKPETLAQKFDRLLAFRAELIESAPARIADLAQTGDVRLVLQNHGHHVDDCSAVAVMLWRRGDDPRAAIRQTRQAYQTLLAERDRLDPQQTIPPAAIAGIADWDLIYSLFWLIGEPAQPLLHDPEMLGQRYFAYARYLLHRTTGSAVPEAVAAAVARFQATHDQFVDRNFRDLLALLDADRATAEPLCARIAANWSKRRTMAFYNTSAPLPAGFDASNDLSVDYQLACIIRAKGWHFTGSPHYWCWD